MVTFYLNVHCLLTEVWMFVMDRLEAFNTSATHADCSERSAAPLLAVRQAIQQPSDTDEWLSLSEGEIRSKRSKSPTVERRHTYSGSSVM